MRIDHFYRVSRFNEKILDIPMPSAPTPMSDEAMLAKTEHMLREELEETLAALRAGDLRESVDGLADLIVVALGVFHRLGVNADRALSEVCRSNDTKTPGVVASRGFENDAVKGANYSPPDLGEVICESDHRPFPVPIVFVECANKIAKKSEDYNAGGVERDQYWVFGFKSIVHEVWKKTLRVVSLSKSEKRPNFESILDSLLDLINYACFGAEWLLDHGHD